MEYKCSICQKVFTCKTETLIKANKKRHEKSCKARLIREERKIHYRREGIETYEETCQHCQKVFTGKQEDFVKRNVVRHILKNCHKGKLCCFIFYY